MRNELLLQAVQEAIEYAKQWDLFPDSIDAKTRWEKGLERVTQLIKHMLVEAQDIRGAVALTKECEYSVDESLEPENLIPFSNLPAEFALVHVADLRKSLVALNSLGLRLWS